MTMYWTLLAITTWSLAHLTDLPIGWRGWVGKNSRWWAYFSTEFNEILFFLCLLPLIVLTIVMPPLKRKTAYWIGALVLLVALGYSSMPRY
jgi:hypothetical protein